ncbi:unnamed protein product [Rhodiola kirilowii]
MYNPKNHNPIEAGQTATTHSKSQPSQIAPYRPFTTFTAYRAKSAKTGRPNKYLHPKNSNPTEAAAQPQSMASSNPASLSRTAAQPPEAPPPAKNHPPPCPTLPNSPHRSQNRTTQVRDSS